MTKANVKQTKLDYKFKDDSLFDLAMTQSGIDSHHNNERLEFVGDRVLGLCVSSMLYTMFPQEAEGELARRYAALVSTETLADVAISLGLDKTLRHGHMTAGRIRHALANAMEALLGAIFFDSGFDEVRRFVIGIWHDLAASELRPPKDPKTELQEFVQKRDAGALPVYEYTAKAGPANAPVFSVKVTALGLSASGTGQSKKIASLAAADALLKKLAIMNFDD
jgi:ribonuclease-3